MVIVLKFLIAKKIFHFCKLFYLSYLIYKIQCCPFITILPSIPVLLANLVLKVKFCIEIIGKSCFKGSVLYRNYRA